MISNLGLNYNSIQDSENDCSLFRWKYEISIVCYVCGTSWLRNTVLYNNHKILRHFPLAPWVHLTLCGTWTLKINGVGISWMWLRMLLSRFVADCAAFKHIDNWWQYFKTRPQSFKLGVGTTWCESIFNAIIKMVNLTLDSNTTMHRNKRRNTSCYFC